MPRQTLTVIIPVLNEDLMVVALEAALTPVLDTLDLDWSVVFVDDGSTDKTLEKIRAINQRDGRYRAISFSRNFGKEPAMAAGLQMADSDAVVIMDADLQHPPSYLPEFVARWREGNKLVFGQRLQRDADPLARRVYSAIFHRVYGWMTGARLPEGIVDFVLLDRSSVKALNQLEERSRFTKGLFTWVGFNTAVVPFASPERFAGKTTFNTLKLLRFALDGLVSFTTLPLRVWSYVGAVVSLGSLVYSVYFVIATLLYKTDVPGFPSLLVSIYFFAGIQLISLGVIGEYVGRIFEEVKRRPLYVVAAEVGMPQAGPDA
ncbi:MAG: glycosyltransferase family 2 protein [bacterium]